MPRRSRTSPKRHQYTITNYGRYAEVDEPIGSLAPRLLPQRITPVVHSDGHVTMAVGPEITVEEQVARTSGEQFDSDQSDFPSGLITLVAQSLISMSRGQAEIDFSHEIDFCRRLQPDCTRSSTSIWRAVEPSITKWLFGVIRCRGIDPLRAIGEICARLPDNHVVVLAPNRQRVKMIRRYLQRELQLKPTVFAGEDDDCMIEPAMRPRGILEVCVPAKINSNHNHSIDVILCVDPVACVRRQCQLLLQHMPQARLFAFLDGSEAYSPYDRQLLFQHFGFHQLNLLKEGLVYRPTSVHIEPFGARSLNIPSRDHLSVKRFGVWRHGLRNRVVARVACNAHDSRPLAAPRDKSAPKGLLGGPRPKRVAILAGNEEHAETLRRDQLSDWRIFQYRGLVCDRVIVPQEVAASVRWTSFDVVVRADGCNGSPDVIEQIVMAPEQDARPLQIIDVDDSHHPTLRCWSQSRRRAYDSADWREPNIAIEHRIREYLSRSARR